jgi:hypothetical protein
MGRQLAARRSGLICMRSALRAKSKSATRCEPAAAMLGQHRHAELGVVLVAREMRGPH